MDHDLLPALHLAAGAVLANLPWLAGRARLGPARRVAAALAGWGLWAGGAELALRHGGDAPVTAWELWAVTLALFAVLGFPGLVWRYLR